ncbi:hypothetical protein SAMN05720472_0166 [Fibrobacter sp. UWR3]|uniref:hypothetical protein n=1 Tax=Fibrobacter sp. UWR3 TaxID=1896217 RepID=UPI00091560AC|nr:hypothetical protein [Fibrobacter sp. UWR3]SHN05282.1 hypothetical protein SAMN05720472_0166 [Fibrobacter sp. UWR3]
MRILEKKWWTLAAALPVAALVACTSNSPVEVVTPKGQVYSEDEYEELVEQGLVDESGNVIEEDEEEGAAGGDTQKSSSSDSKTASSSDTKTESSSDSKTASSSDSKTASSSDSKTTSSDSKTESSSSAKASSDSGSDKSSSSASGEATSSSSTVRQETLTDGEGNFSVGTNDMEKVSTGEQSELDSLKEILDNGGTIDGFEEVATEFNEQTLTYESFDEGDYYCFTGEGEWRHVTRELLGQYIPHYKNGQAWGNLRHFDVKFMDACEGVYFRRNS